MKDIKTKKNIISEKPIKKSFFSRNFLLIAIIVITIIAFSNVANNNFVNWDDEVYVDNEYINDFSIDGIANLFSSYTKDQLPITLFSLAIDNYIWGKNPMPFHIMNVIFHLINVLLVFYFIKLLTKRDEAGLIAALLFAIHPFRVESVTWVAERKDVLFTMFYLGSLIFYLLYFNKSKKKYLFISLLLSILSVLSKLMAISLPLILFLIDYYYARKVTWKTILEKTPFFIIPIVSGVIHYTTPSESFIATSFLSKYTFTDSFFMASYSLCFYFYKFLLPFNLCVLHPYPNKFSGFLPIEYYVSPLLIILLIYFIYKLWKNILFKKEITFGIIFFLTTISLVLQIIPFGGEVVVAERYSYLPYIGLCFIIAQLYCFVIDNKFKNAYRFKSYILPVIIIIALIFSITTYNRNKVFKNSYTFWGDVIEKYPNYHFGQFSFGIINMMDKNYEVALKQFNITIELNPKYSEAYNARGIIYGYFNNDIKALNDFNKTIEINPNNSQGLLLRGNAYFHLNRLDKACNDWQKSAQLGNQRAEEMIKMNCR